MYTCVCVSVYLCVCVCVCVRTQGKYVCSVPSYDYKGIKSKEAQNSPLAFVYIYWCIFNIWCIVCIYIGVHATIGNSVYILCVYILCIYIVYIYIGVHATTGNSLC